MTPLGQCPRWPIVTVALLLGGSTLAGCADGPPVSASPSSSVTAGPSTSVVVKESTAVPPPVSATGTQTASVAPTAEAVSLPAQSIPTQTAEVHGSGDPIDVRRAAVVQAIRAADGGSFDRVVIQFEGAFGDYRVSYVDQVTEDPTGAPVPLAGSAFLQVSIQNATFDNSFQAGGDVPPLKYQGPRDQTYPHLTSVREIKDAGDFEAVLGLGIGVAKVSGIRAYRLESPTRLVIEVAH